MAGRPVPTLAAHRPRTPNGNVIPWVNVRLADGGVDFMSKHGARADQCWTQRLCQLCGRRIDDIAVLLGGPDHLANLLFDEPPLHPACAAYAQDTCPMVAGRLERTATHQPISNGERGKVCAVDGCDCGGWTSSDPRTDLGKPAHPWFAVWTTGWTPASNMEKTALIGGALTRAQVRKIRRVSIPGQGRCPAEAVDPDEVIGDQLAIDAGVTL